MNRLEQAVSAIVVGASAGGVEALNLLFLCLPANFKIPIVVVLHLSPHSNFIPQAFTPALGTQLKEVEDKENLEPFQTYFAPSNYHVLIENDRSFSLTVEDLVNYSRPSIDVTFSSASEAFGARLAGVLLTGANEDGARGLKIIHDRGGKTFVQDPSSAQNSAMPASAIALFKPDFIADVPTIAKFLGDLPYAE